MPGRSPGDERGVVLLRPRRVRAGVRADQNLRPGPERDDQKHNITGTITLIAGNLVMSGDSGIAIRPSEVGGSELAG
jgi:hypothetical protein